MNYLEVPFVEAITVTILMTQMINGFLPILYFLKKLIYLLLFSDIEIKKLSLLFIYIVKKIRTIIASSSRA